MRTRTLLDSETRASYESITLSQSTWYRNTLEIKMLSSSNQFGQITHSYQRAGKRERERMQLTAFMGYELVMVCLFPQLHSYCSANKPSLAKHGLATVPYHSVCVCACVFNGARSVCLWLMHALIINHNWKGCLCVSTFQRKCLSKLIELCTHRAMEHTERGSPSLPNFLGLWEYFNNLTE